MYFRQTCFSSQNRHCWAHVWPLIQAIVQCVVATEAKPKTSFLSKFFFPEESWPKESPLHTMRRPGSWNQKLTKLIKILSTEMFGGQPKLYRIPIGKFWSWKMSNTDSNIWQHRTALNSMATGSSLHLERCLLQACPALLPCLPSVTALRRTDTLRQDNQSV